MPTATSPVLLIPYMWLGDFVRCHTVVRIAQARWPDRPIDMLTSQNNAPAVDYMPGVRKSIVWDLPRRRLPVSKYLALSRRLRLEEYGTALIMSRAWKTALAPALAGIPERTGFLGEMRFGLITDRRKGERALDGLDRCAVLALPKDAVRPPEWPAPQLVMPPEAASAWLKKSGLDANGRPIVALAPGAIGTGALGNNKRWAPAHFVELGRALTAQGISVWVVGSPNETPTAAAIVAAGGRRVTDLTGSDLRNAIIALSVADAVVTNDSGLMHIAAALGTPTIALFGPTCRRVVGPLNPLAAVIKPPGETHWKERRVDDITPARVLEAVHRTLATAKTELRA